MAKKQPKGKKRPRVRKVNENGKQDTRPIIWSMEFVTSELAKMLKEVKNDKTILFIGELFEDRRYSRQRFSEWATKFKDDAEISDTIRRIESILESRVAKGALKGTYNANFAKFHMINNHDWRDKSEIDPTPKDGPQSLGAIFEAAARKRKESEE